MKKLMSGLFPLVMLVAGCAHTADPNADLEHAYRGGSITSEQYLQIAQERLLRQQAQQQAQQENWRQYQKNNQEVFEGMQQSIDQRKQIDWGKWASENQLQPRPQRSGTGDSPAYLSPRLPAGLEYDQIQTGQGIPTGKTQIGTDGKLWQEVRLATGGTYWRPIR